jgi:hypothetical protein
MGKPTGFIDYLRELPADKASRSYVAMVEFKTLEDTRRWRMLGDFLNAETQRTRRFAKTVVTK